MIANDKSISFDNYINDIKSKSNNYIKFKINLKMLKFICYVNKLFIKIKLTRRNIISNNRLKYIEMNPTTEISYQQKKIQYEKTIFDTRNFFLNK